MNPYPYTIEIQNEFGVPNFPDQRVIEAISHVLFGHDVEPGTGVSVVLTTDEQVRQLNEQYRGVNAPTDILSFPADPLPDEIDGEAPYLGDLIIACPYTIHQADEVGHALDDEFVLLVIHGTLHLLGYDHDDEANQDAMWAEQTRALHEADVPFDVPRFTFGDDHAN